jgi:hypothetical protein
MATGAEHGDASLWQAVAAGEHDAFGQLFDRQRPARVTSTCTPERASLLPPPARATSSLSDSPDQSRRRTSEGTIDAELSSARATLATGQGDITVGFSTLPQSVTASSQQGSITVTVPGTAPYDVSADAQLGSTSVTVPQSAASRHSIRASTQVGSITVTG